VTRPPDSLVEDAMRALADLALDTTAPVSTSDLGVEELLLVRAAGFRPLGLVLGCRVVHAKRRQAGRWADSRELGTLTTAISLAREEAMGHLQDEAARLGADGVVGVRLSVEGLGRGGWGPDQAEVTALGTAVVASPAAPGPEGGWRQPAGRPFTSALSGQDFWALLQAAHQPLGLVLGSCVQHVGPRDPGTVLAALGRNVELPAYTRLLYDARELALQRMQTEARGLAADGVVGVRLRQGGDSWGPHTWEFLAVGTAVRGWHRTQQPPTPQLVLGLDDRQRG